MTSDIDYIITLIDRLLDSWQLNELSYMPTPIVKKELMNLKTQIKAIPHALSNDSTELD
jgi:hypothetical protein